MRNAGRSAICHEHDIRIFNIDFFVAVDVFLDTLIAGIARVVCRLEFVWHEIHAGYMVVGPAHFNGVPNRPWLAWQSRRVDRLRKHYAFHHLPDEPVSEDQHRHSPFFGDRKCFVGEVGRILHAFRRKDDRVVVAMAAAACCLEIVALAWRNAPKARAGARNVHDDSRKIGTAEVRNPFLLERHAGARRAGHCTCTCGCCTIDHVDCRYFRLSLDECAAFCEHVFCHVRSQFILRSDRIAEIGTTSCTDRSFTDCFIAFHKADFFSHILLPQSL